MARTMVHEEADTEQLLKFAEEGRLTKDALAAMLTPEPRGRFLETCALLEKHYTEACTAQHDPCLESGCSAEGEVCLQPLLRAGTEYSRAYAAEWARLYAQHENRL